MKKKSFFERIQAARRLRKEREAGGNDIPSHSPEEFVAPTQSTTSIMPLDRTIQSFRVFVSTWNVGGKSPNPDIDLDSFIQAHDPADIYVLGFQEIVPLSAGNVLVNEDTEPAAKWLSLINQSLNKRNGNNNNNNEEEEEEFAVGSSSSDQWKSCPAVSNSSRFFPKPSLKRLSTIFRSESRRRLKACNCTTELERTVSSNEFCFRCHESEEKDGDDDSDVCNSDDDEEDEDDDDEDDDDDNDGSASSYACPLIISANSDDRNRMKEKKKKRRKKKKYSLVEGKQMVGIFVSVWMRTELIHHVWHLRVSCVTRGLMGGYLGNKGCISVSMSFHQTSFCFICGHLASGEKEGDELRRNLDVTETLKNTHFPRICNTTRMPFNILGHDRIIWFGDLNYRIALNHSETGQLMEANDWEALLDKDQLKIEREAGRVFKGWEEGMIYFAPTYKYSYNSDAYARDNPNPKNRRNPAWCDRILWHGEGIQQTFYIRGESRFSDHRPVCAGFSVDVVVFETSGSKNIPTTHNMKVQVEELLPAIKIMYPKSSGQIISEIVNSQLN